MVKNDTRTLEPCPKMRRVGYKTTENERVSEQLRRTEGSKAKRVNWKETIERRNAIFRNGYFNNQNRVLTLLKTYEKPVRKRNGEVLHGVSRESADMLANPNTPYKPVMRSSIEWGKTGVYQK